MGIAECVGADDFEPALIGEELHGRFDTVERRRGGVVPGRGIAPPVGLPGIRLRLPLVAGAHFLPGVNPEGHQRQGDECRRQCCLEERRRPEPVERGAEIGEPPRPDLQRERHEQRRKRQHHEPIGNQRRPHEAEPVELAPADRAATEIPGGEPVEPAVARQEAGEDQRRHAEGVGGKPVAHEGMEQHHPGRPDDERRDEKPAEDQGEHRELERHRDPRLESLHQERDRDRQRREGHDHQRHHGIGQHLPGEHAGGGDGAGAMDPGKAHAFLADEAFDGVKEDQQSEEEAEGPARDTRRGAGRHELLGVERPGAQGRCGPGLDEDQRPEQPQPRALQQRPGLLSEDRSDRRHKSRQTDRRGRQCSARGHRGMLDRRRPRGAGGGEQAVGISHASIVMLGMGKPPTGGPHGREPYAHEDQPAAKKKAVGNDAGGVVVGDAPVLGEKRAREPPKSGRLDRLHEPVDPARQPLGVEVPEEEDPGDDHHNRQRKNEHRLPRPHPGPHRHPAGEDHHRQGKPDKRRQVAPQ